MTEKEEELLYQKVGFNIKAARVDIGMNQEEFGKLFNLSRASIVNIEAGRQRPSLHLLYDVAAKTSINVNDLMPKISFGEPVSEKFETTIRSFSGGNEKTEETLTKFLNQINSLDK